MSASSEARERSQASAQQSMLEKRPRGTKFLIHAVLIFGAFLLLLPLAWMLSTSLKDLGAVLIIPPQWIPKEPQWDNYIEVFQVTPFARFIANTAIITVLSVLGKILSCSLVAFAFARLRWRGRNTVFLIMLATLMLPPQVTLIPQFVIYRELKWIDTFLPLILPHWFGGPFATFLMRQYFMTIPMELDDAARIDGASYFGIYWRIILPLGKPALAAVAIFTFNGSWNDFLGPLIYLHSQQNYTIQMGLRMFQDQYYTSWHLLMAASLIAMIPVVLIFFFAQRYFIQGIVFTGIKT
jgi:multiple sugar transport system permease protein